MSEPVVRPAGWRGTAAALARAGAAVVDACSQLTAAMLLLLGLAIILGIVLRWLSIDNTWTYDLNLFALAWVAFAGAAFTAHRERHVTAGIALENMLGRGGVVLPLLRFLIIVGFLLLYTRAGFDDALTSWQTHETTIDTVEWPVWVAKAALPVGGALWALAEVARFLRRLSGQAGPAEAVLE